MPPKTSKTAKTSKTEKTAKPKVVPTDSTNLNLGSLEHILHRPDTYIGGIESHSVSRWVIDSEKESLGLVQKNISFVPGLYKIFDEVLVNAMDNKQRDETMNRLKVEINHSDGFVSVWNNGACIPIVEHNEYNIYVPELIFGHLLTGSNFDDTEQRTTGGRNGYGAKLANVFSTKFIVEVGDAERQLKYKQVFGNNMADKNSPIITAFKGSNYTKVTFYPDWKRFGLTGFDVDTISLFGKRVVDAAMCMNSYSKKRTSVFLNNEKIGVASMKDYIALHQGLGEFIVSERINDNWEVAVLACDNGYSEGITFVNGILTHDGGSHLQWVLQQAGNGVSEILSKKMKHNVRSAEVRSYMFVFVNGLVENPAFDGQTKDKLTTASYKLEKSGLKLSTKFLNSIAKSSISEKIENVIASREKRVLNNASGKKTVKLTGIDKLDDANWAGTRRSSECTLILTEGDSAKALAVSGLGVVGRDKYGVYPLRGKLINVRDLSATVASKNNEVGELVRIMGLKYGTEYTKETVKQLRYGGIMIMTDQDTDGSHIKGLIINLLHTFWPSLLKIDGFLHQFITPIVKCTRGKESESFFTLPEYEEWKKTVDGTWRTKYYKGLGTSTAKEAKEYFSELGEHKVAFGWNEQDTSASDDAIDLAFRKKRADDRKAWVAKHRDGTFIDYTTVTVSYESFVNDELRLFSVYDNQRSIPSVVDGFKPSQRKVLFGCFKRNLVDEVKVAQLAGYVSENAAYHHGEVSLTQTIVGMAQDYVGSGNMNLLTPSGQFGTRLAGGKDAASARYIFTKLESITRLVFPREDDPLLNYLEDDGLSVEPSTYCPIVPMVLINGSTGIGTGWSSSVPTYDPKAVIDSVRRKLAGEPPSELVPSFRGFAGSVVSKGDGKFLVSGNIERVDDTTVRITELPIEKWTSTYKLFLDELMNMPVSYASDTKKRKRVAEDSLFITGYTENHTDTTVFFEVSAKKECLDAAARKDGLAEAFKLTKIVHTSNMVLFDRTGNIKRYETPQQIVDDHFISRMELYERRKAYLETKLEEELRCSTERIRFVRDVIDGHVTVGNRSKCEIEAQLETLGYTHRSGDYGYLLGMKLWDLSAEKVRLLENQVRVQEMELDTLRSSTPIDMWNRELDTLEAHL